MKPFKRLNFLFLCSLIIGTFSFVNISICSADLYLNILAVNGTDNDKEKEVEFYLPKELSKEDILNTAGLSLDYDTSEGAFFVHGNVVLKAKETKVYKVLIRDVWKVNHEEIENIKKQIDISFDRLTETEYADVGKVKKENLYTRLDYVVQQQESFNDNIETRVDRFRAYRNEVSKIRKRGVSIKYWRDKVPLAEEAAVFNYIIEVENPTEGLMKIKEKKYYLPEEILPENIKNAQGFDIRYDIDREQAYLTNADELKPNEIKRYNVEINDVWNISQTEIDNLKNRARSTYKFLEETQYVESADYLMGSIKKNLEGVEESQTINRKIGDHISEYRINIGRYSTAQGDVESLEEFLEAVRENLERSKVKNVLQKIRSLRTIVEIAGSIFKKPSINKAWKIIIAIISFVGIYTVLHFGFWGNKSKESKEADEDTKEST